MAENYVGRTKKDLEDYCVALEQELTTVRQKREELKDKHDKLEKRCIREITSFQEQENELERSIRFSENEANRLKNPEVREKIYAEVDGRDGYCPDIGRWIKNREVECESLREQLFKVGSKREKLEEKYNQEIESPRQKENELGQNVKELKRIIAGEDFCGYCQKHLDPESFYQNNGKFCDAECYTNRFATGTRKSVLDKFRRLPVKIITGTSETPGKYDRFVTWEGETRRTTARDIFSYQQLKAVKAELEEGEKPLSFTLWHFHRRYYWCDEWSEDEETKIFLKTSARKKVCLHYSQPWSSLFNGYDTLKIGEKEELVEKENRK